MTDAEHMAKIIAGPLGYYAMYPDRLAMGRCKPTKEDAIASRDDGIFANCPTHQWCCAAQAAMG